MITISISNNIIENKSLLFYHIRDLRRNRRFISLSVAKTIATVLVSSILDYCNSLLYNIANKDIVKLQRLKFFSKGGNNALSSLCAASKIIALAPCALLHYFKMCTVAYQALLSTQPAYLNSMLTPARNSRQLRSTNSKPVYIHRVKTKTGTRAFSVA